MRTYRLERTQIIPRSRRDTFAFFCDAYNLPQLTPPFLNFKILTPPPIQLRVGTIIEYRLGLLGLGFGWRTLIEAWEPDRMFVDRQINGPYSLWHHTHDFEAVDERRTFMRDVVVYRIECEPLGGFLHHLFVGDMLKRIFDYRAEAVSRLLTPKTKSSQMRTYERQHPAAKPQQGRA